MLPQTLDIFNDVEPFRYIEILLYGDGLVYATPDGSVTFYSSPVNTTHPGTAMLNFQDRYNNHEISFYYKYEDYINEEELQATLHGLGLDPDLFWLLILFSYDYACDVCLNGKCYPESTGSQIKNLLSLLNEESIITVKSKKDKTIISNPTVISKIKEWIESAYESEKEQLDKEIPVENIDELFHDKEESNSVMIWLFAVLLKFFLDRATNTKKRKSKENDISLNKLSLISLLIYRTRLSLNKNFLYGDEALKGFLKQYKNKQIKSYSPIYH